MSLLHCCSLVQELSRIFKTMAIVAAFSFQENKNLFIGYENFKTKFYLMIEIFVLDGPLLSQLPNGGTKNRMLGNIHLHIAFLPR